MTLVEWAGVALVTGSLALGLLSWGFWRVLGAVWASWFTLEAVAIGLAGAAISLGRFPRPEDQTLIVASVLVAVTIWHIVMVVTTPLSK